jgi:polysaccharide biosynthesis protein PelD
MTPGNTNPEKPDRRRFLGIRSSAALEIAVFLAMALAIDHAFLDGARFRSMPQHPFWILVLLISAQYGTAEGLLAAVASSAALLVHNVPPQTVSQDRFMWLFEVLRLPLAWIFASLVLGGLRTRQIRERERLRRALAEASHREQKLSEAYKRLDAAKAALETRVATQLRTAVGLYESARAIEKLDPSEVLLGVSNLIRSVMNPEKFSLYLLDNSGLELALEEGWSAKDTFPRRYAAGDAIFEEVVGRQRVLSVANPEDEAVLSGAGMIAAALVAPDAGRVIGMLKIEKLGFLDLTFSNVQTLKALCQWIAAAYENALRFQAARTEGIVNAETNLFAYGFLARQLSLLTLLARRIGFDLTIIVVRLENPSELTQDQRRLVPVAFSRAVAHSLRQSDLAFDYQRTGTEFAIVLPATRIEGAHIAIDKIKTALDSEPWLGTPPRFSFGLQIIYEMSQAQSPNMELQRV